MQALQKWKSALASWTILAALESGARAQTVDFRIDEALQNITALVRADMVGYATFFDGNKFIQCRRLPDRQLRCEAAGISMQPSLRSVLTGDRLNRLAGLGWNVDPSFGNHVRIFPADVATATAARQIAQTLTEAYGADLSAVEITTTWIADVPCPPRAGRSQNLAGSVNDMPSMRTVAVRGCSYVNTEGTLQQVASSAELVARYGPTITGEIQRLRINGTRRVWTVFDAGIGYVQCAPETTPPVIYCEAQSSESWAALTAILTPERIARLHGMGYADPGRSPNYWKHYPLDQFTDTAIAGEVLTVLYDAYNYTGAMKLKVTTK